MEANIKTVGCKECHSQGYHIVNENEFSHAKLCKCVQNCKHCGGNGYISYKNENNYDLLGKCPGCSLIRSNIKKYNLTKIPSKFSGVMMVDTYFPKTGDQQKALKFVKDSFIRHYPNEPGFLLMGPPGVGKTHLAIGAISELTLERGISCMFKDFFLLLAELRQAYSEGVSENEILRPLIDAEVLVIDEMGKGKSNEWEINILDQLISNRYNSSKKTLVTTNFPSREYSDHVYEKGELLEERIGERIFSRLNEMCNFIYIEADDFRMK